MSLVNQMLKDLEQRRADLPRGDSLHGLRAAPESASPQRNLWPTLLIAAALGGVGYGWWLTIAERSLEAPPLAIAPAAAQGWVAVKTAAEPSAKDIDAAWDKTWEPRTAKAVAVAEITEAHAERSEVAAMEPAAPAPSTSKPPAPKPTPTTTATAVVQAERTGSTPSMRKTLRAPSPAEQATQAYAQALSALRGGDSAGAEHHLRTALDQAPGHAQSAETLSALLLQQRRSQEAEDVLAEAIAAAPQSPRLLMLHARLLTDAGRDTEAVALLQTPALTTDAESQALLGALQQRRGNDAQATIAYRQALTRAPQRGTWWLGLAISLERTQQPSAALEAYRRALNDRALDQKVSNYVRERINALAASQG